MSKCARRWGCATNIIIPPILVKRENRETRANQGGRRISLLPPEVVKKWWVGGRYGGGLDTERVRNMRSVFGIAIPLFRKLYVFGQNVATGHRPALSLFVDAH